MLVDRMTESGYFSERDCKSKCQLLKMSQTSKDKAILIFWKPAELEHIRVLRVVYYVVPTEYIKGLQPICTDSGLPN